MAGESATQTEPELDIEGWAQKLRAARNALEQARSAADQADEAFRATVRAAFAAGLTVVPIQEATGLTTSRLYQIKAGRRT